MQLDPVRVLLKFLLRRKPEAVAPEDITPDFLHGDAFNSLPGGDQRRLLRTRYEWLIEQRKGIKGTFRHRELGHEMLQLDRMMSVLRKKGRSHHTAGN
jgi:hypothetical protein